MLSLSYPVCRGIGSGKGGCETVPLSMSDVFPSEDCNYGAVNLSEGPTP